MASSERHLLDSLPSLAHVIDDDGASEVEIDDDEQMTAAVDGDALCLHVRVHVEGGDENESTIGAFAKRVHGLVRRRRGEHQHDVLVVVVGSETAT